MENKCNKTPNKYLDHVYCQSGDGKNYMRPSNGTMERLVGGSTNADLMAILKENKQLKAMLILHLDLIQEQSDQLLAKDKQLCSLKEELQTVRTKNTQLESQIHDLQRQIQVAKRTPTVPLVEQALLSPPPLAKIQCNKENSSSPTNIIGECNGKLITKIILQRVNLPDGTFIETTHSPNSTTISETAFEENAANQLLVEQDVEENIEDMFTTEDSDDETIKTVKEKIDEVTKKTKQATLTASGQSTLPVQVCVTPPTPSRGKQMPLMLWHAPNMHSEEEEDSGSGDESTADTEQHENTETKKSKLTETPKKNTRKGAQSSGRQQSQRSAQMQQHTHKRKRCAYITTPELYASREWENEDEAVCDYEFSQAEAQALHAEAPMLEIPKWTEHELTPSYCIEGTEDLSEESFIKRHAKLEIDEKRRKKWDVQQIREQRRIEKLKRRHYKSDVQTNEQEILKSFYPQLECLQTICFVNELPVQAFGEMIPKLPSGDFILPWLQIESNGTNLKTATTPTTSSNITATATTPITTTTTTTTTTTSNCPISSSVEIMANSTASSTSAQAQAQMLKSSFVFLKKRKRQQSSSAATNRQRTSVAVAKVTSGTGTAITTPTTKSTNAVETEIPVEEPVSNTVEEKK